MTAVAEVLSTIAPNSDPRGCDLPTCPVCADSMVGCGSFRFSFRQRHQLSLDLRYLRLRFRDQAFAAPICLQLRLLAFPASRFSAARCRLLPSRRAYVRKNFRSCPSKSRP